MQTIFESIVRKENDHTNLLRNVMERYPRVAASTLSYLIGRSFSEADAASFLFRTQCSFSGLDGREVPDLRVEGQDFRCLIEAKVDPGLHLTSAQQDGYRGFFESVGEKHLCFLVPDRWQHSESIDRVRASLQSSDIAVYERRWRGLVETLKDAAKAVGDPILSEVISFWKWRFEIESMSPKEKDSLNAWSSEQYLAFRKLQKTIDQAKDLFASRGYETELETSFTTSYGFYLKRGRLYLLWIGIWAPTSIPLTYGFHATKSIWLRPNPIPLSPISIQPELCTSFGFRRELTGEIVVSEAPGWFPRSNGDIRQRPSWQGF
jgi:hypothetical protein